MSESYDPREILSIATFKERCIESGDWYLRGMFPLSDLKFNSEDVMDSYLSSPINNTMFGTVLNSIDHSNQQC
jgi:hypothetical protein